MCIEALLAGIVLAIAVQAQGCASWVLGVPARGLALRAGPGVWIMNWNSGIFRLGMSGALLWTVFWAERYLCLQADSLWGGQCGPQPRLFQCAIVGLAVILTFWIRRGLFSPPVPRDVPQKRRARFKRIAVR